MDWIALGPTRIPELYVFVVSVNNCEKFISCLSTIAKSLTGLLQKDEKWVIGMPRSVWCSHIKVCVFWYCFICDLVLWSLPHGIRSCDLTLIARWQWEAQSACTDKRWGKNSCGAIVRCQHRGNELEPRENVMIPVKTGNLGVGKRLQIFSEHHKGKRAIFKMHT